MSLLSKIFGDANERYLKLLRSSVDAINGFEEAITTLSDEQIRQKTVELRAKVAKGYADKAEEIQRLENLVRETLSDEDRIVLRKTLIGVRNEPLNAVLPEAYAIVREAARRTLGQRHFDVQLMGGIVLHEGQVAEMKTGEGKTLTSTLAVYLNALTGRGVHVVTVNDYLASRDAVWMGQIYHFLGLSVGVIVHDSAYRYDPTKASSTDDTKRDLGVSLEMEFLTPVTRRQAYETDITYGTNNEYGFDYLRDNMAISIADTVQRELHFAIIDEVDSILIDEARTPLIISQADAESTDKYFTFAQIVNQLEPNVDYAVDEKLRAATLTESGIAKVETSLGVENIYVEQGIQTVHHIEQALKAKTLYSRDKDYTIKDNQVIIVDEFTGRMLPGRRYSEGLHQAIEAKENVAIQRESKTMATITFQNYFRLYDKIAGMTGTAETEAEELNKIYALDVTAVPTNRPMIRKDLSDRIYKSENGKFQAVVREIKDRHEKGQPVLVGTISIEKNERLSHLLELEGLPFNMLNAKQHEREAEIIAQAGKRGAITIATNMAGRGVDIKLGGSPFNAQEYEAIIALGGLHVIGTERHESRRIDNQLRGRSGRQGEPGSTQFYVSLEDDLMRIFAAERVKILMKSWPEDMPIENGFVSKSIESAQKRVEGHNFDIRKHLVEYDDVVNKQRMFVYGRRNRILRTDNGNRDDLVRFATEELVQEVEDLVLFHTSGEVAVAWDKKEIKDAVHMLLSLSENDYRQFVEKVQEKNDQHVQRTTMLELLNQSASDRLGTLLDALDTNLRSDDHINPSSEIVKMLYLRSIDALWVEHLETIQYLRTGIGLRGYGQRDPLVEYKKESKDLFNTLVSSIRKQFVYSLMNVGVGKPTHIHQHEQRSVRAQKAELDAFSGSEAEQKQLVVPTKPKDEQGQKIGRNDPCFCGSGKKYKKCHGA